MAALPFTGNAFHKAEMEYHGKFGHTLGRIQYIALMSRIYAEVSHTGFLRQITGKQSRRILDGTWETPGEEVVRKAAVSQSEMTYIGRRQATVAQGVALRPIFELCTCEKGCKRRGFSNEALWRQEAAENQLK